MVLQGQESGLSSFASLFEGLRSSSRQRRWYGFDLSLPGRPHLYNGGPGWRSWTNGLQRGTSPSWRNHLLASGRNHSWKYPGTPCNGADPNGGHTPAARVIGKA